MPWPTWAFKNTALIAPTTKLALTVHCLTLENYVPLIQLSTCFSVYYLQSYVPGTTIIRAKLLWVNNHCLKFLLYLPNLCGLVLIIKRINDNNIILIIKRITLMTDIVLKNYHRYLHSIYVLWKNYCNTFDNTEIIILNLKNHSKKV